MPKYWEDFSVGDTCFLEYGTITEEDVYGFASLSKDFDPIYLDEEYAKQSPFRSRLAQGLLLMSKLTGLYYDFWQVRGSSLGIVEWSWKLHDPIYLGDRIRFEIRVEQMRETDDPGIGLLHKYFSIRNQEDRILQNGHFAILIRKSGIRNNTASDF